MICICERCGKSYEHDEAVEQFETALPGIYYNLSVDENLCGDCAIKYAEDYIDETGEHPDDWVVMPDAFED